MMLNTAITRSGNLLSGQVGFPHLADQSVRSGTVGSGQLCSGNMDPNFIAGLGAVSLLSGQVTSGFLGNASVVSGSIGSGQVGRPHISQSTGSGPLVVFSDTPIIANPTISNSGTPTSPAIGDKLFGFTEVNRNRLGYVDPSGFVQHICQDNFIVSRNPTGSTFVKGTAVYMSGGSTTLPLIDLAQANSRATMPCFGLVAEDIAGNTNGYVMVLGHLENFDTSAFAAGDKLYVSDVSGGFLTATPPAFPQFVGQVIRANAVLGKMYVNPDGEILLASGQVTSGIIGDNAVVSGSITAGSVAVQHLVSGIVSGVILAGQIGSGQVGLGNLTSGLVSGIVKSGQIGSGQIDSVHIRDKGLLSGSFGSGQVSSGAIDPAFVAGLGSVSLTSGQVTSGFLGDASVVSGSIASGSISRFHIANAGVTSGNIASGAVGHFHLADQSVLSGNVGSGQLCSGVMDPNFILGLGTVTLTSGQVTSGFLGDASVVSGSIASGSISRFAIASGSLLGFELGSGAIVSGRIASGQIGVNHLQSGLVSGVILAGQLGSGQIAIGNLQSGLLSGIVLSGQLGSGQVGLVHLFSGLVSGVILAGQLGSGQIAIGNLQSGLLSGIVLSGQLGSGQVGLVHLFSGLISGVILAGQFGSGQIAIGNLQSGLLSGIVLSGQLGSGQVGVPHLFSGLVSGIMLSGQIGSGVIGSVHLADGAVLSGDVSSGQIGKPHIASGAVGSGQLAVGGTPTGTKLLQDDFTWVSPGAASITSGSVGQTAFNSGVSTRFGTPVVSGLGGILPLTSETISGVRAVQIGPSGDVRIAMASVSGRMPAVGVVIDNVLSGLQTNVQALGVFGVTSGLVDTSGYSQLVYVGRSGQVVTASGQFNSGGLLSGDVSQPLGTLIGSGQLFLSVAAMLPFIIAQITSGNVASGQLMTYHFASGAQVMHATELAPINSGALGHTPAVITEEAISGVRAVQISPSGTVRIAMSAVSGRMPAQGVVYDNVLSGIRVNVHVAGFVQYPNAGSGLSADFSGVNGRRVLVGRSGNLVFYSGSYGSGGFASGGGGGFMSQCVGVVVNSGGVMFNVNPANAVSGGNYSGGFNGPHLWIYGG